MFLTRFLSKGEQKMEKKSKNDEGVDSHDFKKSMLSVGVATALISSGVCA